MSENAVYSCLNLKLPDFPEASDPVWDQAPKAWLVDTETAERPFLLTEFRLLRDDAQGALFLRFDGEDDALVSTFRWDNETLYRQDVFELFITPDDPMDGYLELEVSPYDLRFAGDIRYTPQGERVLSMREKMPDLRTRTQYDEKAHRTQSVWRLAYEAFRTKPVSGQEWRINVFRADYSTRGLSLQAWQATKAPNFHVPAAFGRLRFL